MATNIRFKRKLSSGHSGVQLQAGEPYYNTAEKKLYIGDDTARDLPATLDPARKLHLTQIVYEDPSDDNSRGYNSGDADIEFSIGDAKDNYYEKTVNNVRVSKALILDKMFYGDLEKRDQLADNMGLQEVPEGTVFFLQVD